MVRGLRIFLWVATLSATLTPVFCAVAIEYANNPDMPGNCLLKESRISVPSGTTWELPDQCVRVSCGGKGSNMYIRYTGCGLVDAQFPCSIVQDMSKPHPKCCPDIFCPKTKN